MSVSIAFSAAAHAQFATAPGSPFPAGTQPTNVVVADFDRDGKSGLAIANEVNNNVTVLLGNGARGFAAAPGSPFPAGSEPSSVATGDFNGDGKSDLAIADAGAITVLLNTAGYSYVM